MQNVERRAACSDAAVHWRTGKIPRPDRPIRASTAMMAQRTLEARPCRWCREILLPMGRNRGSLTKSKFRRDFNAVEGAGDWTAGVARSARWPGTADTQLDRRGCARERDSLIAKPTALRLKWLRDQTNPRRGCRARRGMLARSQGSHRVEANLRAAACRAVCLRGLHDLCAFPRPPSSALRKADRRSLDLSRAL